VIQKLISVYAKRFFIKVEQASIQNDHIHLLLRAGRRSRFQAFFRVLSGQIAQRLGWMVTDTQGKTEKVWKYRPFSRVVRGWRAYKIVRNYIQLNELEVKGMIPYQKRRLKGLTPEQLQTLWSN
jgi:putative transposase